MQAIRALLWKTRYIYILHRDIYYAYLMNFVLRRYFYDALYIICFRISNKSTQKRIVFIEILAVILLVGLIVHMI